jgi:predicted RecA/RadA family phage recombinase
LGIPRTLKYTNSNAVAAGDVVVINGNVCVAVNAYGANAEGVYVFRGRVEFPKEASLAVAPGEKVYWVAANGNVNKTSAGNTLCGIAVENSLTTDTIVLCELQNN